MDLRLLLFLMIFWTTGQANLEEDLLKTLKTQFQKENKFLIETLKKSSGQNSAKDKMLTGFEHLSEENGSDFVDDLISHLTNNQKMAMIRLFEDPSESISIDKVKQLPIVWQSLTLSKTYFLNKTGDWMEVILGQTPDLSLLYSLGMRMKMLGASATNQAMMSNLVPPPFLQHFKFFGSHLHSQLIKFLTMDKIKRIPKNESLNAVDILKDGWFQVQSGQQEAWYQLFKESTDNYLKGNLKEIEKYGYLLGGAPLRDIELLCESATFENGSSRWFPVIEKSEMNSMRLQAIWNCLSEEDKKLLFSSLAGNLHSTQIQRYYELHDWTPEDQAFMERKDIPFENGLMFSKLSPSPVLSSRLTIPELSNLIIATDWNVESVSFAGLTYGQAMVLYKQWTQENPYHTPLEIPEQLLHVVPAHTIQSMYHYHLILRKYHFIQQSGKMLQSQMSALHEGLRSQLWEKDTMEMILDSHPQCFEAESPAEFRKNLHLVLEALPEVEEAKYDGVLEVARKLRNLPRELQTAWLEAAFQNHQIGENQYWNTSTLLQVSEGTRTAIVLLGLNCQQIERIRPSDTMLVLTAYHYLMEIHALESEAPQHIPRHARKCWANKIRTYLKMKSVLAEVDVSHEANLMSMMSTAEIKTIGGEILLGWGAHVLMSISDVNVKNEVAEAVAALPPCHIINNVITFSEAHLLANQNIPYSMNLGYLSRMANFFPYIDDLEKKVTHSDFKLFVQSLSEHQRSICTSKQMRESLRELLIVSFGHPEHWSSLDLVQLGDLLIVMEEKDLSLVNPHSLVRANSLLVTSASYSRPVPEFLKEVKQIPYHEACRRWLPSQESEEFEAALRRLSDFYTLGSHLSIQTVDNVGRRSKRDTWDNSKLWTNAMNLVIERYTNGKLSESQQQMCKQIIVAGQSTLESRKQIGTDMEFFEAVKEMTTGLIEMDNQEQLNELDMIERVKQVKYKIVQEIIKLLDWKPNHLNISRNTFNFVMGLSTTAVEDTYNFYVEKSSPCPTAAENPKARSSAEDSDRRGKVSNINYKQLYTKVFQLLNEGHKSGRFTGEQKLNSGEIRTAGLSALARETLKILTMLDGNADASLRDVLKIIREKKTNGTFTKQHQEQMSQITNEILLKISQELIKYLNLSKKDLEVDEHGFEDIKSADSSRVEESYNLYSEKLITSSVSTEKSAEPQTFTNRYETTEPQTITNRYEQRLAETTTQEERLAETTTLEERMVETTTPEKRLIETTTLEERLVETTTQEERLAETTTQEERLAETTTLEERLVETTTQKERLVEITTQEERLVETTTSEKRLVETTMPEERLIKTTTQGERLVETTTQEERLVETTAQEERLVGTTTQEEGLAETTIQERPVETTTQFYENSTQDSTLASQVKVSQENSFDLNVYQLFRNVSLALSKRQWNGNLSDTHKQKWAQIVNDGKSAMVIETLKILDTPYGNIDVTMKDVRSIMEKKKENGSFTVENEEEIKEITKVILLKMVQEIIFALRLSEEDLDITAEELNYITKLDTSNIEITGYKSSSVHKVAETSSDVDKNARTPSVSTRSSSSVNYSSLFRRLSELLNTWNQSGRLTHAQFNKWVDIVMDVQDDLVRLTLRVLGMDQDDELPVQEVIAIIKEKRAKGGVTEEIQREIEEAAKPIIIQMVLDIIQALDLNINNLDFSEEEMEYLSSLNTTFSSAEVRTDSSSGEVYQSRMKQYRSLGEKLSNKALLIVQEWFTAGNITEEEKGECFNIIKKCNSAFIRASLKLFNVRDYSHEERLKVLAEKKADMSAEELEKINDIGVEALVKMVQEIVKLLGLNQEHMAVSSDEFDTIINLRTPFIQDSYDYYAQPGETDAAFEKVDLQENENYGLLWDVNHIKCNVLRIAGEAVTGFRETILRKMEADQVEACLDTIGSFKLDPTTAHSVWNEVKRALFPDGGVTGTQMILLGSLLPTVARFDLPMLDLNRYNLDAISLLGRHLHDGCYSADCDFSSVPSRVVQQYIHINKVDKFSAVELESFGQLLCGLTQKDWDEKVTEEVFKEVHFIFNRMSCNSSVWEAREAVERKVLAVNNQPEEWTPSDVAHMGWLVGTLAPSNLIKISPCSLEGVSGVAARMWTQQHWNNLTAQHIKHIGPHAMSLIDESSFPKVQDIIYFGKDKRNALRSAASEGTEQILWMDKLLKKMEDLDSSSP